MDAQTGPEHRIVRRDPHRFSRFHPEARAVIPPGAEGEMEWKTTRVLIAERIAALTAAESPGTAEPTSS